MFMCVCVSMCVCVRACVRGRAYLIQKSKWDCAYKYVYEWLTRSILMPIRAVYRIFAKGGELGVCQKEGGEAVLSCRAATGGWVQEGDVPLLAHIFYLSEIHLHEL